MGLLRRLAGFPCISILRPPLTVHALICVHVEPFSRVFQRCLITVDYTVWQNMLCERKREVWMGTSFTQPKLEACRESGSLEI
jgi:hypothetical protein